MDEMATPAQVAEALHTTEASLAQMRYRGDGPVFARVGRRRVLYRWCDVERWVEESLHTRTDQVLESAVRDVNRVARVSVPKGGPARSQPKAAGKSADWL